MDRQEPVRASRLVVGIPTFRRPRDLSRLLTALLPHLDEVEAMLAAPAEVTVLVVDNDSEETAWAPFSALDDPRIRYVTEASPGVAAARNRVLDECDALAADLLLCIDDDETPEPGWAVSLVRAWQTWDVAGVCGRVVTRTASPLDPWIEAGEFYARSHRNRLRAGDPVHRAATNNLLLELDAVRALGLRFDDRFSFSGGEDSMFTGTLSENGYRLAWCPTATVIDHLPDDRATKRFVLHRSFALGNGTVRAEAALATSPGRHVWIRSRALLTGLVRVSTGSLQCTWGRACGSLRNEALGARAAARGLGELAALVHITPKPYSYDRPAARRAPS